MGGDSIYKDKGIYYIKNTVNGKYYIGQSSYSIHRRWLLHKWQLRNGIHPNDHLQRAWNEYGEEVFEFKILYLTDKDEPLDDLEIEYISKYNAYSEGYNQTLGGNSNHGYKPSEETKKKIGIANHKRMLGKKLSPETRKRMSASAKGHIKSPEHRKHLSESLTGIKRTEEHKQKCREANQGTKQKTAKYSEELIREIKTRMKNGERPCDLAREYGISNSYLCAIRLGLRWSCIEV